MSIKYIADLMLSTLYISYFFQKLNEKGKLQIKDKSISVNSTSNEDIKKKKRNWTFWFNCHMIFEMLIRVSSFALFLYWLRKL